MRKTAKWKWALMLVAAIAVLTVTVYQVYTRIMEPEWVVQRDAVKAAYEKTVLTKANKVERFVGDQIYTVIQGEDKIGQPVIVWVSEQEVRSAMGSSGVTAEQANTSTVTQYPDAEIIRTMPGIMEGQPVWEVFYKRKQENGEDRHFYSYYTFAEGKLIDTWRLNIQ
jgi:uncharacterized protein YpmB